MIILANLILTPVRVAWSLYVTTVLWAWFAVPMGLPTLTMAHAFGLGLVLSAFRPGKLSDKRALSFFVPDSEREREDKRVAALIRNAVFSLYFGLILGLGWVARAVTP